MYEGRREFRELERAARRAGYSKKRAPEYVPYRMLEVEAAANAVYAWAAEQILARRLPEERPSDPAEYAAAVHHEHQTLRHRAHHKLMQAFLEPEIFDGAVTITRHHHANQQPTATTRRERTPLSPGSGDVARRSLDSDKRPCPSSLVRLSEARKQRLGRGPHLARAGDRPA